MLAYDDMPFDETLLKTTFLNNTLYEYLIALCLVIVTYGILIVLKRLIAGRLRELSERTHTKVDDVAVSVISTVNGYFYLAVALYIGVLYLDLPPGVEQIFFYAMVIIFTIYAARASQKIAMYGLQSAMEKSHKTKDLDDHIKGFIQHIISIIIWLIAFLIILQNLGYNITTLLGGLGVAGIAVAFALQNILTDLFAYISIYLDKPFKVGDFIIVGNDMGVVEQIGLKSTRIRTLEGQQLVMTNKELTESRINNYKRMEKRRVVFSIGVTYETPNRKLKAIPEKIKEIISDIEVTEFDRAHFKSYGDFSLIFEIVYYIDTSEYNVYMDTQQHINLQIKEWMEKEEIEFAYPTQQLYLKKQ